MYKYRRNIGRKKVSERQRDREISERGIPNRNSKVLNVVMLVILELQTVFHTQRIFVKCLLTICHLSNSDNSLVITIKRKAQNISLGVNFLFFTLYNKYCLTGGACLQKIYYSTFRLCQDPIVTGRTHLTSQRVFHLVLQAFCDFFISQQQW